MILYAKGFMNVLNTLNPVTASEFKNMTNIHLGCLAEAEGSFHLNPHALAGTTMNERRSFVVVPRALE